jgi:hypothetical protein
LSLSNSQNSRWKVDVKCSRVVSRIWSKTPFLQTPGIYTRRLCSVINDPVFREQMTRFQTKSRTEWSWDCRCAYNCALDFSSRGSRLRNKENDIKRTHSSSNIWLLIALQKAIWSDASGGPWIVRLVDFVGPNVPCFLGAAS